MRASRRQRGVSPSEIAVGRGRPDAKASAQPLDLSLGTRREQCVPNQLSTLAVRRVPRPGCEATSGVGDIADQFLWNVRAR